MTFYHSPHQTSVSPVFYLSLEKTHLDVPKRSSYEENKLTEDNLKIKFFSSFLV